MISDLILIAKRFSVPSAYGRRDGVRDFFAQYPDGVYIATDAGAPAGWEGYAVWFGGEGERYAERFMELIRDGYILERFLRARVGGFLVFTFRCRLKMRRFGTLGKPNGSEPGPSPIDDWWGLKLTMPNGGNIILRKNGSPTAVNLEVSTDAVHWSEWDLVGTDYTYALSSGQTLCVRNTSMTTTYFSTDASNYYKFVFNAITEASGSIGSLLCKDKSNVELKSNAFRNLFDSNTYLTTAPEIPFVTYFANSFWETFKGCTSLVETPVFHCVELDSQACYGMFEGCTNLTIAHDMPLIGVGSYSLGRIYLNCASLVNPPQLGTPLMHDTSSFVSAFLGCTSLIKTPNLESTVLNPNSYSGMFYNCVSLKEVRTNMTDISAVGCLNNWLYGVAATGDFYCPAELTIPTGSSGIPTGWTRHDI